MIPVRFHHLRAVGRSPAHARLVLRGEEGESTREMQRGTAVHAILFETKRVIRYTVEDAKAYGGKPEGKKVSRQGKAWEAFEAANIDAEILGGEEYEKAHRMADAVRADKLAMSVLGGTRERTILWDHLGRRCRATPDAAEYDSHVTELKTSSTSDPVRFTSHALRMHYHGQLAWQLDGVIASHLGRPSAAFVVAVESAPPFPVTTLRLTERALEKGRGLYHLWLERLLSCERANEWPSYAQSVVDLDVPEDAGYTFTDSEGADEGDADAGALIT